VKEGSSGRSSQYLLLVAPATCDRFEFLKTFQNVSKLKKVIPKPGKHYCIARKDTSSSVPKNCTKFSRRFGAVNSGNGYNVNGI
jgi:hypothetical protein